MAYNYQTSPPYPNNTWVTSSTTSTNNIYIKDIYKAWANMRTQIPTPRTPTPKVPTFHKIEEQDLMKLLEGEKNEISG